MQIKKIYTSYFGNYRNIPPEYQCYSIANSKPRLHIPTWVDVVPDWKNVNALKHQTITPTEFAIQYLSKLNKLSDEKLLDFLSSINSEVLVLMCWESHYFDCHRMLLAYWLSKKLNMQIEEYPSSYYVPIEEQKFTQALQTIEHCS